MIADRRCEIDTGLGRHRDRSTAALALLASTWESVSLSRQATMARSSFGAIQVPTLDAVDDELRKLRQRVGEAIKRELARHPLGDWLAAYSGIRGVHTARVVAMIGDPLRFPGRQCANGHHLPSDYDGPCPLPVQDGDSWSPCEAEAGEVRRGSGVRSLWHYLGLHVVDGKMPRRRKGQQCTWNPKGRTALLMPDGIADQIIRHRVEPWRTVYDETKERIARRGLVEDDLEVAHYPEQGPSRSTLGGADFFCESEWCSGPADNQRGVGDVDATGPTDGANCSPDRGADFCSESGRALGPSVRPITAHKIARMVAVKAFVGDLLMAWKERVA